MKNLFLFSIAPVQEFIEQARKTQDLYAGSFILSHLCNTASDMAVSKYGAKIIFPWTENRASINRFLAVIGDESNDKLTAIGFDLQGAVLQEFNQMADVILNKLGITKPMYFDEQIGNYLNILWLFESYEDGAFNQIYNEVERKFGAIKNVRYFAQFEQPSACKCSVTGKHNVLFYRKGGKRGFIPDFAVKVPEQVPLKYIAPQEKLGAIAFVKRGVDQYFDSNNYQRDFPSTAEIALMDVLDEWQNELPSKKVEPELLFDIKNGYSYSSSEGISSDEWKRAQQVCAILEKHNVDFSPYYALVHFDGDSMGQWLGGSYLREGVSLDDFQRDLSRELGKFAINAREKLLIRPRGITVYAGGDDFLGFVNLKYLFDVLRELRSEFEMIDLAEYTDKKPTFSAGVVIAHYRAPLGWVLDWARKMEHTAKCFGDEKDALALAVLKYSGEIQQSVYRWRCAGGWIVDYMSVLVNKINNEGKTSPHEFSDNFIRTIHQEFLRLMNEDGNTSGIVEEKLLFTEVRRLLGRSSMLCRNIGETRQEFSLRKHIMVESMAKCLEELYLYSVSLNNFFSFLHIADFISREVSR